MISTMIWKKTPSVSKKKERCVAVVSPTKEKKETDVGLKVRNFHASRSLVSTSPFPSDLSFWHGSPNHLEEWLFLSPKSGSKEEKEEKNRDPDGERNNLWSINDIKPGHQRILTRKRSCPGESR